MYLPSGQNIDEFVFSSEQILGNVALHTDSGSSGEQAV